LKIPQLIITMRLYHDYNEIRLRKNEIIGLS